MEQTLDQQLLIVMQAQLTNRTVQYFSQDNNDWVDDGEPNPRRWSYFKYRIKPEGNEGK